MSLSPPSSSASESDDLDNQSPRVYFGPLQTPERNFLATNRGLFAPVQSQSSSLRRSPRLSSPRPPSPSPREADQMDNDVQEMALVAQLVNETLDEDDDNVDLNLATEGEAPDEEPSSALAERISHATSNPSPPPSPTPLPMSFFDPYPSTTAEPGTDYQTDLFSLNFSGSSQHGTNALPEISFTPASENPMAGLSGPQGPHLPNDQQILISVDATSIPQTLTYDDQTKESSSHVQPLMSVDDMLFTSPALLRSSGSTQENEVATVPPGIQTGELTPSDETLGNMEVDGPHEVSQAPTARSQVQLFIDEQATTPPLRRSTRPRRSVTPVPAAPQVFPPTGPVFTAPVPSPARTQVRRKSRIPQPVEEIVSDSQSEAEDLLRTPSQHTKRRSRSRSQSPGKTSLAFHRELGSLSPTSSSVLATLNFMDTEPIQAAESTEVEPVAESAISSASIFPPASEFAAPEPVPPTTPGRTGPIRFSSPSRSALPASPTKFRLQPLAADDPRNTPARRVVMRQAPDPDSTIMGIPLPPPTPARRVLVQPELQPTPKASAMKLSSPVKPTFFRKDASAEPPQRMVPNLKGKERALDPSGPASSSSSVLKAGQLPFPLIASSVAPPSVEQSVSVDPLQTASKAKPAAARSNLKQPSSSSKIPRIGAKPYTRIIPKKDTNGPSEKGEPSKAPTKPPSGDSSTTVRRPIRLVGEVSRPTASSISRTKPTITTSAAALKRKRDEKASPVKPRVIIRTLPPVAAQTEPSSSLSSRVQQLVASKNAASAVKKPEPPKYRLVQSVMTPKPAPIQQHESSKPTEQVATTEASDVMSNVSSSISNTPAPVERSPSPPSSPPPQPRPTTPPPNLTVQQEALLPGSPMNQDLPELHSSPEHPPIVTITDSSPVAASPPEPEPLATRRTTRTRRGVVNTDNALTLENSARPSSRRKASTRSMSDDVFAGMSMTALKDLTIQNTEKNQRYLTAKLETEVVKKDGTRPESPMVKIKTISQRLADDKEKQREERAHRRARRSDELSSDVDMSDVGYSSPVEEETEVKHTRGAGEDEDYVSPLKEFSDLRKNLFGPTDMVVDSKRRVKWDRGLFTTVYLDEVKLGSRETRKENRDLKGILAATAKALPLDILGNLPQADMPLADLVPENVIVKKFVYESDPPPAPPVVPKNTRSRKKK